MPDKKQTLTEKMQERLSVLEKQQTELQNNLVATQGAIFILEELLQDQDGAN